MASQNQRVKFYLPFKAWGLIPTGLEPRKVGAKKELFVARVGISMADFRVRRLLLSLLLPHFVLPFYRIFF
jgi:hypothetical protein